MGSTHLLLTDPIHNIVKNLYVIQNYLRIIYKQKSICKYKIFFKNLLLILIYYIIYNYYYSNPGPLSIHTQIITTAPTPNLQSNTH